MSEGARVVKSFASRISATERPATARLALQGAGPERASQGSGPAPGGFIKLRLEKSQLKVLFKESQDGRVAKVQRLLASEAVFLAGLDLELIRPAGFRQRIDERD